MHRLPPSGFSKLPGGNQLVNNGTVLQLITDAMPVKKARRFRRYIVIDFHHSRREINRWKIVHFYSWLLGLSKWTRPEGSGDTLSSTLRIFKATGGKSTYKQWCIILVDCRGYPSGGVEPGQKVQGIHRHRQYPVQGRPTRNLWERKNLNLVQAHLDILYINLIQYTYIIMITIFSNIYTFCDCFQTTLKMYWRQDYFLFWCFLEIWKKYICGRGH